MKYIFFFICINNIILHSNNIIVFINPSTIFGINSEYFLPAIQNFKLLGFHKINKKSLDERCYNEVFMKFLKNYTIYYDEKKTNFYMFNWNGKIYPTKEKKIAAEELYQALKKYKDENPYDKIILIACSHGGSVVLSMANLLKQDKYCIDIVILLGTPINEENEAYAIQKINNINFVFKKIVNIYSKSDWIQKMDIFFNNFSFCKQTIVEMPNIINYEIDNIGHINLWHTYPWSDAFVIYIPELLKKFI